ncbi:MAG TPA: YceI family protein, partial [Candidatus Limnocylindria bacterium]|nr:YceI family protein [Candidatus Limnocylindria bacterium]
FDIELLGVTVDGQNGQHLGATATVTIDRTDFGLTWNMPVPNGVLVSEKVKVDVDLQAIDEAAAKTRGLAA